MSDGLYVVDDMRSGYVNIINDVMQVGFEVAPRGMATREVIGAKIVLTDPLNAVPFDVGRKLNTGIGAAETAQLVAGVSDADQLISVASAFSRFTNDGALLGAYGPRIHGQMIDVVKALSRDSDTRQAYAMIWRHDELERDDVNDVPCTLNLGWRVRDGKLNMTTTMRSNDLWLGVPYDFWMFTRLQLTLAWVLGVEVGTYTHFANSLHVYERDFIAAKGLHHPDATTQAPQGFHPVGTDTRPGHRDFSQALNRLKQARLWATNAVLGVGDFGPNEWYAQRLDEHLSKNLLCTHCRYVLPRTDEWFNCDQLDRLRLARCKRCLWAQELRRRSDDPDRQLRKRCASYGLTVEDYRIMLERQHGVCKTCSRVPETGRWKDFHIDHDHVTGEVRGLLCNECNNALGLVHDDVNTLQRMIEYLGD